MGHGFHLQGIHTSHVWCAGTCPAPAVFPNVKVPPEQTREAGYSECAMDGLAVKSRKGDAGGGLALWHSRCQSLTISTTPAHAFCSAALCVYFATAPSLSLLGAAPQVSGAPLPGLSQTCHAAMPPACSRAVLFFSLRTEGTLDKGSLHGSCPTLKGTKYAATKWWVSFLGAGG